MKQSLRKTPSHLHLSYKYGAGSDRLMGRLFTLVRDGVVLTLSIDLTANFRTREKAAAQAADALNLVHNHHRLGSLQSGDNLLRSRLIRAWELVENPQLRMCLDLGQRGRFLYSVQPHSLFTGGIQLDVQQELEEEVRAGRALALQQPDHTRTQA